MPHWAVISFAVIALAVGLSGGFRQLAVLVTASMLLIYIGVVLAFLKFRLVDKGHPEGTIRLKWGYTISFAALITLCWYFCQLKTEELIGIGIFLGVLAVIYFVKSKMLILGK